MSTDSKQRINSDNSVDWDAGSVLSLPNGGFLIKGFRVDPVPSDPGKCLVSSRHEIGLGSFSDIPWRYRLSLASLKGMLSGNRNLKSNRAMEKEEGFVLRLMNESYNGEILDPEKGLSEKDFKVAGMLRLRCREAVQIFSETSEPIIESWIHPVDIYYMITKPTADWLKRVTGAVNLSSLERLNKKTPIVAQERFERARDNIFKALLKPSCNVVLLKGVAGVGKSTLMAYITQEFLNMRVPVRLQGRLVGSIGIELFMPSANSAEEAHKTALRSTMASKNVVWVMDEAHRLVERGSTSAVDTVLLFIDQGAHLILLSDQSYLLEKREAFVRRLTPVYLKPAEHGEVQEITARFAQHQSQMTQVTAGGEVIETAIRLSQGIPFAQPHAAINLLGHTIAACEMRGEDEVSPVHVENELKEILSQGDTPQRMPGNLEEFIKIVREEGYCGHGRFLRKFGRYFLRANRLRFRPDRRAGAVWACMLVGNSGNGKSMLLRIVSKMILGSERKICVIRGSSFKERHAIQTLIGSPKSYVGYEEGGVLQNFFKHSPDGVLLFEEPELANQNILDLLLEILEGTFTAGDGSIQSTCGVTVLIASNAGCESSRIRVGFASSDQGNKKKLAREALENLFTPAIISRLGSRNIFYLEPLEPPALRNILRLAAYNYGRTEDVLVHMEDDAAAKIVEGENVALYGARPVLDRFHNDIESLIDKELTRSSGDIDKIKISIDGNGHICCRTTFKGP